MLQFTDTDSTSVRRYTRAFVYVACSEYIALYVESGTIDRTRARCNQDTLIIEKALM